MSAFISNGRQSISANRQISRTISAKAIDPTPIHSNNWLIFLMFTRRDFHICRIVIENELKKSYGRNFYAHYIKALMYKDDGKIQEALDEFQICYKLNPNNIRSIKEVAFCLFLLRRYRLALEVYLEAENLSDKSDWEIFYNIGKCLLKLREPQKALEYVRRAAQLSQLPEPFLLLNKMLTANGDFAAAINVCNSAVDYCPESIEILTELGLSHIRLGQSQQAFERLGSALALDPGNYRCLLAIGCIIQNHGDYDVALAKYRRAAQRKTDSPALWSNIGLCFYAKQKYVGAISCLQRSLWTSPLNWRTLYNLGLVHLSTHQPASAFHFLCASVNIQPDYAASFMLLGIALQHLDDPENAHKAFEQAALLAPDDATVMINYILSLRDRGDVDQALRKLLLFREMIQDAPDVEDEILALAEKLSMVLSRTSEEKPAPAAPPEEPEYATIDEAAPAVILDDPSEV